MATYRLVTVIVHTPPAISDIATNDQIDVYWDDSTSSITTQKNSVDWVGTSASYLGEFNDNYTMVNGITSYEAEYAVSGYSYCSGADLKWFKMLMDYAPYPYMTQQTTTDSPVCDTGGGAVCDISFSGAPTITHATDLTSGGSITVTATSSNGTVKYGLRNSAYADMTNTSGAFTGISPGSWTVYAKDANDCTASLSFKILFKPTDTEHYRFTWASVQVGQGTSHDARVRIYEREYIGSVVEVDYGDSSPFRLNKPKQGEINNKLYPVHPTNATLSLISEQDYQFLPLFTQDNKKYRVVYEIDEGSGFTEIWQGFIVPSVYRENLIAAPYIVEIQITDNVKTLEEELFTDNDGNLMNGSVKIIAVIAHIMKKTGLTLKIRSGINIFETNHLKTATDDPLDQTYVDVACYRDGAEPFDCWRVLESLLRPFGARIYQYDNQWIIEEIDRATATYAYRVFTANGVYESNSTFNPIIDVKAPSITSRAAFIGRDQSLEIIPAYGKIDITSKLNFIGSIVAGGFEKEDLLAPESEVFDIVQGVYSSEEGFKDWTLRLNGTSGVSFGRVVVGRRGDSSRTGLQEEETTRSVGAFFHDPIAWSGNLRNAYIESSVKNYQYGPNDELKLKFEYSTPARPEYEFMVLRVMLKVGDKYLQPDLSWGASEAIYRSYPAVSNSLQTFEVSVAVPGTDVVVDSTVQLRIYFYASSFYDYGLPSKTDDPDDGTDGLADLDGLVTTTIDYDYRLDLYRKFTVGGYEAFFREFYELRISDAAEDVPNGVIRAGDFDATTNPKIWSRISAISVKSDGNRRRGLDLKFYIDNVALDALINGQPPPEEDNLSLTISKYINESLAVELYNFDLPDITNGKNMYNNYFRLSNGTPTASWARSGISEALTLQEILLKVLGANHSAPTFRITGSFINEFQRIGINNYIRITKSGSSLSVSNTEFSTDLTGWDQSSLPLLSGTWSWVADNSGSAEVTLSGSDDSKKIYQTISHEGGYVEVTVNLKAIPALSTNNAEDVLWVLLYNGSDIIHAEKMISFPALTSESDYSFTYTLHAPANSTRIGFYIKRVTGTGEVTYQVSKFAPAGKDVQEIYQIADYQSDERQNTYFFELMQQNKGYISLGSIDTGGNNQSGGSTGRAHSSGHSSGFN